MRFLVRDTLFCTIGSLGRGLASRRKPRASLPIAITDDVHLSTKDVTARLRGRGDFKTYAQLRRRRVRVRWKYIFTKRSIHTLFSYAPAFIHSWIHPNAVSDAGLSGPINQNGFDLVTVVFSGELDLLALQARSFARFLGDDFGGNILILVNDLRCARLIRRIERIILPQYGRWHSRVRVIAFHRLARRLDPSNGWIIQQALKLAAATSIDRPFYVVFDAKNHLIAPVGSATFFDADGAARQACQNVPTCMAQHHATGATYFGVDPNEQSAQFVPMTPFVFHTQTTRELIQHIEAREQATISDFFCDTRCLSEFLLYGSYIARTPTLLKRHYVDARMQTITLWKDSGPIDAAIARAQNPEFVCFGVHREVLAGADHDQMTLLTRFWRDRTLLRSDETLAGLATRGHRHPSDRGRGRSLAALSMAALGGVSAMLAPNPSLSYLAVLAFGTISLVLTATVVKPGRGNALLVLASLSIALVAIEAFCIMRTQDIRLTGEPSLFAKDPDLGWKPRPGTHRIVKTVNGRQIYTANYTIDERGHRRTLSEPKSPDYVFLGDSFTFGEGIDDADTLPQSFADLLGRKVGVVNLGVPAYSPAQVLRALQDHLYDNAIGSAKQFFMLTAAWHTDRIACKDDWVAGAPRYVTIDDHLVSDGQCAVPYRSAVMRFLDRTATYKVLVSPRWPLAQSEDIVNYINIVSEAARVARDQYQASLYVIYLRNVGYLHFSGYSDDEIINCLRARGVEVFDLTSPNDGKDGFAISGDGHPNGKANRMRSVELLRHLNAAGRLRMPPANPPSNLRVVTVRG